MRRDRNRQAQPAGQHVEFSVALGDSVCIPVDFLLPFSTAAPAALATLVLRTSHVRLISCSLSVRRPLSTLQVLLVLEEVLRVAPAAVFIAAHRVQAITRVSLGRANPTAWGKPILICLRFRIEAACHLASDVRLIGSAKLLQGVAAVDRT